MRDGFLSTVILYVIAAVAFAILIVFGMQFVMSYGAFGPEYRHAGALTRNASGWWAGRLVPLVCGIVAVCMAAFGGRVGRRMCVVLFGLAVVAYRAG